MNSYKQKDCVLCLDSITITFLNLFRQQIIMPLMLNVCLVFLCYENFRFLFFSLAFRHWLCNHNESENS